MTRLLALVVLAACATDPAEMAADIAGVPAVDPFVPALPGPDLHVPHVVRGETIIAVIDDISPGAVVWLAVGTSAGQGPCLPQFGGVCLDIRAPRLLASGQADRSGVARLPFVVPAGLTLNHVALQAVSSEPWGTTASQVLVRDVQDGLPTPILVNVVTPPRFVEMTPEAVRVNGNTVFVDLAYGGGCAQHDFAITWDGTFMESFPVQVGLRLWHDDHNDMCDAWIMETRRFDLTPIVARWPYGEPETAYLSIEGFSAPWSF